MDKPHQISLVTLLDLIRSQLEDLYDCECQLESELEELVKGCDSRELASAIKHERHQVLGHKERLEDAFSRLGVSVRRAKCRGIEGILEWGKEVTQSTGEVVLRDAALVGIVQRIQHYKLASYGISRTLAEHADLSDVSILLQHTLNEIGKSDRNFTRIAENDINLRAEDLKAAT